MKWIANEKWHPKQKGEFLEDGSYLLKVPYSDERELIGEILRHGNGVIVSNPQSLIIMVRDTIKKSLSFYQ